MQSKQLQAKVLAQAAKDGELHLLCWHIAAFKAGKESTITLPNRTIPIVPVVLWPNAGGYAEQADLSRLLAELLAKSMRTYLKTTADLLPTLNLYSELVASGFAWEEWQITEVETDTICPHCGEVNADRCCADWKPKPKPKRKQRV